MNKYSFSQRHEQLKYFSPVRSYESVFDVEELNDLCEFMFRKTGRWRTSETGNLFFALNINQLVKKYFRKLSQYIDFTDVTTVHGNFFHTPHQYGFHTDMPEESLEVFEDGDVVFKSLLIPLYTLPKTAKCHIMFFKERIVDFGCTLDRGPSKSQTHYHSYNDYSEIKNIYDVEGNPLVYKEDVFDEEIFKKYNMGQTSPRTRFDGFHIEKIFDWTPGSLIIFDTSQVHCSNKGLVKKEFITKAGLRISLLKNYKGNRKPIDFTDHSTESLFED